MRDVHLWGQNHQTTTTKATLVHSGFSFSELQANKVCGWYVVPCVCYGV